MRPLPNNTGCPPMSGVNSTTDISLSFLELENRQHPKHSRDTLHKIYDISGTGQLPADSRL